MFAPSTLSVAPTRLGRSSRLVCGLGFAILGSAVIAAAAHVAVPFWPVPLTLQTLAVIGLGAVLGPAIGCAAVVAYALEGLAGLPVFAHGAGLATLAGSTGGYIVGFVPAAIMAGLAARCGWLAHPVKAVVAFVAADAALFACGIAWLTTLIGWDKAIAAGLVPFLAGEAVKIALLVAATRVLPRRA